MAAFGRVSIIIALFAGCNALSKLDSLEQLEQVAQQEAWQGEDARPRPSFEPAVDESGIESRATEAPAARVVDHGTSPGKASLHRNGSAAPHPAAVAANQSLAAQKHGVNHQKAQKASSVATSPVNSTAGSYTGSNVSTATKEFAVDSSSKNTRDATGNEAIGHTQGDHAVSTANASDVADDNSTLDQSDQQSILICNIFSSTDLLVFSSDMADNVTMPFKTCRHVELPRASEVTLQFMAEFTVVGSFSITATEDDRRAMALAVFGTGDDLNAAEFQSHQFRPHDLVDVAVFASTDAVEAAAQAALASNRTAEDAWASNETLSGPPAGITIWSDQAFEELPFNAVVSMAPGKYRIETGRHTQSFDAIANGSYVVLVVGSDPADEDVLIYTASSLAWRREYHTFLAFLFCVLSKMLMR